jgi:hypothetical protein
MMFELSALPGVSRLILVSNKKHTRYSEADVIELTDGRLLLALGRKDGSSDFSPGTLIGMLSRDRGVSWDDEPHVIQGPFEDVGDLMSVSFSRTSRGIHLFFLGRGPDAKSDTRVYQMISSDEGQSWGKPIRVSERPGYHVVNNARVIRTKSGRMIVPSAHLDGPWEKHDRMGVYVIFSDDEGRTWQRSNDLSLSKGDRPRPLMEPGVAQCADGSLYMTIRTAEGFLYEARSRDDGATWTDFGATKLPSPAAPSTVVRAPESDDLWMFWINRPAGAWKQRTPLSFASSSDHGKTWSQPRDIENAGDHSFGYYSFNVIDGHVLLTYYNWHDRGQPGFQQTSLRQRTIPLDWFAGKVVPPVFRKGREPVLAEEGRIVSANSGLLMEKSRWRLWYTQGTLGPEGEQLRVHHAESNDAGLTWKTLGPAKLAQVAESSSTYHPSVHRDGAAIVMYLWRRDAGDDSGLYRYVSSDDGKSFVPDPPTPLMVSNWTKAERARQVGEGRVSNDAFDMHRGERMWEYYAACLEKATDPKTIIKHDNAAGWLRFIGRSACADGMSFPPPEIVIRRYDGEDPPDTQFYGLQVFRRRGFYLGVLHTYHVDSQVIQPEWAWSHDGVSWARTRIKCIALGDEGAFDSRMILFGALTETRDELVWLYSGAEWRHNAFKKGTVGSCIGRATLPLAELDAWLEALPQP